MTNKDEITKQRTIGVYVHIPFCEKKCSYCDFLSFDQLDAEAHNLYFNALKNEISLTPNQGRLVDSIFFGGGTPSMVDVELISGTMNCLKERFCLDDKAEISIEANPNSITQGKLDAWLTMGINRLSIGAQSASADVLAVLGRVHSRDMIFSSYKDARSAGFKNVNVDLIFSVPGQNESVWDETLEEMLELRPEHISFYALETSEGTPLHDKIRCGELKPPDEETDRRMYHKALCMIKKAGYTHYEISNAALNGFECRHNLKYWSMADYLGLGLGAHSFTGGRRLSNTIDFGSYISGKGGFRAACHENSKSDDMSEFMFLGLRRIGGVSVASFFRRFGLDLFTVYGAQIWKMSDMGLIQSRTVSNDRYISLTDKGIDISNSVFCEFIIPNT